MARHTGDYTVAESSLPATADDIDPWLDKDVDVYLVGTEGGGRQKYHLFLQDSRAHVLTFVGEETAATPG